MERWKREVYKERPQRNACENFDTKSSNPLNILPACV